MDEEAKALLKQNIELAKENNEMLKRLIRAQKLSNIYRVVYWTIIILSTFGAYYFIEPYISNFLHFNTVPTTQGGTSMTDMVNSLGDRQQFQNLVNQTQNKN